jgi:Tol biopolymer transport system component
MNLRYRPGYPARTILVHLRQRVLAYRSLRRFNTIRQLTWVERDGTRGASFGEAGDISFPRMSPDQKSIVYTRDDEDKPLLFLYDSDRKTSTRLTLSNNADAYAEWMPDGRGLVYATGSPIGSAIVQHPIHGAGDKTTVIEGDTLFPSGVSPDGKLLVARYVRAGLSRLVILSLESGNRVSLGEGVQLQMAYGSFSPDGRWLLYSAVVNGRSDVFVGPVRTGTGGPADARETRQISTSGGSEPLWRADGKEIFYIALQQTA